MTEREPNQKQKQKKKKGKKKKKKKKEYSGSRYPRLSPSSSFVALAPPFRFGSNTTAPSSGLFLFSLFYSQYFRIRGRHQTIRFYPKQTDQLTTDEQDKEKQNSELLERQKERQTELQREGKKERQREKERERERGIMNNAKVGHNRTITPPTNLTRRTRFISRAYAGSSRQRFFLFHSSPALSIKSSLLSLESQETPCKVIHALSSPRKRSIHPSIEQHIRSNPHPDKCRPFSQVLIRSMPACLVVAHSLPK